LESAPTVFSTAGGDLFVWQDDSGAIFLKLRGGLSNPIELAEHEALELSALLSRLAKRS
jgi:hypothetical protein